MSAGYNLSFDYPYSNRIRSAVMRMERENPHWQPQLFDVKNGMYGGVVPVGTGRRSVGFNDYAEYSTFYNKAPKGYKSSGNDGYNYYHQNELDLINKSNMPYINYDRNNIKNAGLVPYGSDLEIYDSIKNNVKRNFNKSQLRGGKLNKEEKKFHDIIVRAALDSEMEGGISKKDFKKALVASEPILRKVGATGVRIGLPLVSGAVAQTLGVPAPVAMGLSKIGAEVLAKKIEGGFRVFNPMDGQSMLSDVIVRAAKQAKVGGKINKKKYEKGLDISKELIKQLSKEMAIAGAKYSMKYILPMVANEVAIRVGIDPKLAMELAQIAGAIIAEESPKLDSEGYIEIGNPKMGSGYKLNKSEKAIHDAIVLAVNKSMSGGYMSGEMDYEGGFNKKEFKKALSVTGDAALKLAGPAAKVAIPMIAKEVGNTLGVPPVVSGAIGKATAEVLNKKVIQPQLNKKNGGVGQYKGGRKNKK